MSGKTIDILAFGEPMREFAEIEENGHRLMLPGFGGDTMNLAVAAARMEARVAVFTALGDDPFGRDFLDLWDAEGIDRSGVITLPGRRTGIYFITYGPQGHVFSYVRDGSAASLVTPSDVPGDLIARSQVLHVSGISQAISASACDAVFAAIGMARASGTLVSYDTNLRLRLWPLERARAVILAAAAQCDIVRPSIEDAQLLMGLSDPDAIADRFLDLGPSLVALTLGSEGSLVATREGRWRVPGVSVEAVDAAGAGDTFGGAFLAEYLRGAHPADAARVGNVAAALATTGRGAVGPMPHRAKVMAAVEGSRSGGA